MARTQEAEHGGDDPGERRWHHLRPQPRRPTDLMGFSSTLWMAVCWVILVLAVILPFPWW